MGSCLSLSELGIVGSLTRKMYDFFLLNGRFSKNFSSFPKNHKIFTEHVAGITLMRKVWALGSLAAIPESNLTDHQNAKAQSWLCSVTALTWVTTTAQLYKMV